MWPLFQKQRGIHVQIACGPAVLFSVVRCAAAAIHVLGVAGKQSLTADAAGDIAPGLGISL
jgi:hypothetical protein